MTKENVSYAEQEEHIANFKNWLKTCPEENLIDVIDVTNTLDLPESRKLAAAILDKKIRTKLKKKRVLPRRYSLSYVSPIIFC